MSVDGEEFWSIVPDKGFHPIRVPMIEALLWIGEPLSAIGLVDVLDGFLTMWEAAHHLQLLEALDLVEPTSAGSSDKGKESVFEVSFQLKEATSRDD